ncbi:MAG TPA: pyrroline-5-carboxylate reductase [Candidatus Binataceae bacterium]|nr:pyrroline-5-carboxylate reductase [Candidatus Binataceae bacterium]
MKKLGFIGAGNMAEALAHGLIVHKVFKPANLIASDVAAERRRRLARALKITTTADNLEVIREARAIVLAVKPQTIDDVLAEIAPAIPGGAAARLFISIAAGVTLERLCRGLSPRARVIRVMPNAAAMVGQGMAALVRSAKASKADEAFALRIFKAVGDAVAVRDENVLDAVTALSGSGPAYVYLFVKALADAGASEGIPRELAIRMALKTVRGAEQVMRESGRDPADLIRVVASPGGTTEAALRRFAEAGFSDIVARAVHAAADRSRELGRGN